MTIKKVTVEDLQGVHGGAGRKGRPKAKTKKTFKTVLKKLSPKIKPGKQVLHAGKP